MKKLFSKSLLLCNFKFKLTQLVILLLFFISNTVAAQNLALNKPVVVSSVESPGTNAKHFVNDGDYSTYWASGYNDDEWVYIDLQDEYNLGELKIHWEGIAYTKRYAIAISSDNSNYQTVYTEENGDGGIDVINLNGIKGRYLKINCFERASVYGNAIYEIEIYLHEVEQLFPDGTATDQDGNTFEWINYGTQDWAIEDAKVTSYRDGTPIPLDDFESYVGPGKRNYYLYDSSKTAFYNWSAVMGIFNEATYQDSSLPRKEFAPEGWRVPTISDVQALADYLVTEGYNYDGSTEIYGGLEVTNYNKLGKSVASKTGWKEITDYTNNGSESNVGMNPDTNNSSGLNFKSGGRHQYTFSQEGANAFYWTTDLHPSSNLYAAGFGIGWITNSLYQQYTSRGGAMAVRFVRDAQTASTNDYSKFAAIYPNPTSSIVFIEGGAVYNIEVYSLQGRKLMTQKGNSIDLSSLSNAMYLIKATNTTNMQQQIYKVIKE